MSWKKKVKGHMKGRGKYGISVESTAAEKKRLTTMKGRGLTKQTFRTKAAAEKVLKGIKKYRPAVYKRRKPRLIELK